MNALIKRIREIPETVKATIVFAIASFATSGINYITTPIFTRITSQTDYGAVQVYTACYSIVQVFASMTLIYPGVLNVGLYEHRDNRWKYLSSMLGATTSMTLLLALLYVIFRSAVEALFTLPTSLMILMLLSCLVAPATTFWTFKQRYEYKYRLAFFVTVGSALLAQAVSVAAVLMMRNVEGADIPAVRLWSAGCVNLLVALVLYIYICREGKQFIDIPLWRSMFIVALPLIPHYIGSTILSDTDRIMISSMVGKDKAGIYSLAAILSAIGVLLWRALTVTYSPFINAKLGERRFDEIRKAVRPLLVLVGVFCVIAALGAPEIIRILAEEDYYEGIYVIPPVAASVFIHALYDNFSAVSFFNKKSLGIMIATVVAALSNLILNFIFIPVFGYYAAGYTTLASNIVLTSMHYYISRRVERERVFDGKFSLLSTIAVVCACLLCNLLYGTMILRYALIVLLMIYVITKLKPLFETLVSMKVQ